jgi:hypothetical protein
VKLLNRDPDRRPDSGMEALGAKLTGRGCDELHGSAGLRTDASVGDGALVRAGPTGDWAGDADRQAGWQPGVAEVDGLVVVPRDGSDRSASFDSIRRFGSSTPRGAFARSPDASGDAAKPPPGWYAYRVTGAAELPSWAVEIALTIERPVVPEREAPATSLANGSRGEGVQALLLLRAPRRVRWLDGVAQAIAEVESVAGVRPAGLGVESVIDGGDRRGPRLLTGPPLPGLAPVASAVARAQLEAAGCRGLPAPLRRRRPAVGGLRRSWRSTAGSVVTCDGPHGTSAQAVVALHGLGNVTAIAPPPGGALVLRAGRPGAVGAWHADWCSARPPRSDWDARPAVSAPELAPRDGTPSCSTARRHCSSSGREARPCRHLRHRHRRPPSPRWRPCSRPAWRRQVSAASRPTRRGTWR